MLLYVLGLSCGAVEDFLEALGVFIGSTAVYENAQKAVSASRPIQKQALAKGGQGPQVDSDGSYAKVRGEHAGVLAVVPVSAAICWGCRASPAKAARRYWQ